MICTVLRRVVGRLDEEAAHGASRPSDRERHRVEFGRRPGVVRPRRIAARAGGRRCGPLPLGAHTARAARHIIPRHACGKTRTLPDRRSKEPFSARCTRRGPCSRICCSGTSARTRGKACRGTVPPGIANIAPGRTRRGLIHAPDARAIAKLLLARSILLLTRGTTGASVHPRCGESELPASSYISACWDTPCESIQRRHRESYRPD